MSPPTLLILLPLAGSLVAGLAGSRARWVALAVALLELLLSLVTLALLDPGSHDFQLQQRIAWMPLLGISYHVGVDTLSGLFLAATSLLWVCVILASWRQQVMPALYFSLLLMLAGSTMGVFCALDLVLFFLFWELTLVPVFFLISLWGVGPDCRQAAYKYTLLMLAGGIPLLFGLLQTALYPPRPLFDLPSLLANPLPPSLQTGVLLLLILGFGVKTPVVPFHTWLPTVAMAGPVAVAAIMTGLKLGAYGLLRFAMPLAPDAAREYHWLLAGLGVLGILYGGLASLVQTNLRRLLAYASISHVGLVLLGFSAMTLQGVQGALLQLLNFALISGGLFLLAGFLHQRFGSTDIIHLGGLARSMPLAASLFLLLGLGSLGLPLTSGFPAEQLLLFSALATHRGAGLAALGGAILAAAAFFAFYRHAFLGPLRRPELGRGPDLLRHERLAILILAGGLVAGGLFPHGVMAFTQAAARAWVHALMAP